MLFSKVIVSAFLGTTAVFASNIEKRDTSTILSDISNISGQVNNLATAAKQADSSDFQNLLPLVSKLDDTLNSATNDANSLSAVSDSDQGQILAAAQGLYPGVISALTDTVQNPVLQKSDVKPIVDGQLGDIQKATDSFGNALIAKASNSQVNAAAKQLLSAIDSAFSSALSGQTPTSSSLSSVTIGSTGPTSAPSGTTGTTVPTTAPIYTTGSAGSSPPVYSTGVVSTPAPLPSGSSPVAPVYTGAAAKDFLNGALMLAAAGAAAAVY